MNTYDRLVAEAVKDIGYTEGKNNSQKFGAWYGWNNVAWCMIAVQYWHAAVGRALPYKTASCTQLLNWYKEHMPERVLKEPRKGAIAIFKFSSAIYHTGIVESFTAAKVTCIEGNTSKGTTGSQANGDGVYRRTRNRSTVTAYIDGIGETGKAAAYEVKDGVRIVTVPVEAFRLLLADKPKKSAALGSYCNANFFSTYKENGVTFTLPVGHLLCDVDEAALSAPERKYIRERGTVAGGKWLFDSSRWKFDNPFYQKTLSTLTVKDGRAEISEMAGISGSGYDYAVSGVPVMRNGEDVIFRTFVRGQGYDGSTLYATKHIFLGLKENRRFIHVLGWKTTTGNMITSAEAFKKFKALGFRDVIKLDGGGSYYLNVNGTEIDETAEDRRVNAIITFGPAEMAGNPYTMTTATLRKGSKGEGVKWLQWQLTSLGYSCGEVDGDFGGKTYAAVIAFQKDKGLTVDGVVGPMTRAALCR